MWILKPQRVWMLLPATDLGMQKLFLFQNITCHTFVFFNKSFEKEIQVEEALECYGVFREKG